MKKHDTNDNETDDVNDELNIKVHHNNIFFYEDITVKSVFQLNNEIHQLEKKLLKMKIDYNMENPPNIFLFIQSDGGDLYQGLSAMRTIETCQVPVTTIVDGFAASAATFLFLGGHERKIKKYSQMLIHQLQTGGWYKYDELEDELYNSQNLMKIIKEIYKSKSTIPVKRLDQILKKELCLTTEECVKYKLAESVI